METRRRNALYGKCRCCNTEGHHRDLMKEYNENGRREIYYNMIMECFNLFLSTKDDLNKLICITCVLRLRDAFAFRSLVSATERQLLGSMVDKDTVFVNVPVQQNHIMVPELDIKPEVVNMKQEPVDVTDDEPHTDGDDVEDSEMPLQNADDSDTSEAIKDKDSFLVEGETDFVARFYTPDFRLPTRTTLYANSLSGFVKQLDLLKDKATNTVGFLNPFDYVSDQASGNSSVISTISVIKIRKEDIPRSDKMVCDSQYESKDICQALSKSPDITTSRENATQKEIEENACNKYQMSKMVDVVEVKLLGDVQRNEILLKPDTCLDVNGLSSFLKIGLTENIPISISNVSSILRDETIESQDHYQITQTETNSEENDFSPSDESDFDPNSAYMSDDTDDDINTEDVYYDEQLVKKQMHSNKRKCENIQKYKNRNTVSRREKISNKIQFDEDEVVSPEIQKDKCEQRHDYKKVGKRRWNRRNACFYCQELVTNYSRHLLRKHPNEIEVIKYKSINDVDLKVRKQKRQEITDKLRNKGNFLHNSKVYFDKDGEKTILPVKRNTQKSSPSAFATCKMCLGTFKRSTFFRHFRKCGAGTNDCQTPGCKKRVLYNNSITFIPKIESASVELRDKILSHLRSDEISLVVKNNKRFENTRPAKVSIINESEKKGKLKKNKYSVDESDDEIKGKLKKKKSNVDESDDEIKGKLKKKKSNADESDDEIKGKLKKKKSNADESDDEIKGKLKKKKSNVDESDDEIKGKLKKKKSNADESDDEIKTNSDNKRIKKRLVKVSSSSKTESEDEKTDRRKVTHRKWTDEEIKVVKKHLHYYIQEKINPGKAKCMEVLKKEPVLHNRTWMQLNTYVNNIYKKK